MIVLGIETSCDESSVALVKDGHDVIDVMTWSQVRLHQPFGGVVPEIASRAHAEVLPGLTEALLKKSKVAPAAIDLLAVTHCPGLVGALLVGVSFANALAYAWSRPVVGINHLEAHLYSACLAERETFRFPALALLVSGGHTFLIRMHSLQEYTILGETLDDAVGEAFDKTAKLLGLPYPGGPVIDKLAKEGNPDRFDFPRSMVDRKTNLNFSFSGLKTAVRYCVQKLLRQEPSGTLSESLQKDLAASFQRAVVDILALRTEQALQGGVYKTLVVCGGVAANQELKSRMHALGSKQHIPVIIPPLQLCTDNAVMISGLACYKQNEASSRVSTVRANARI